MKREREGEICNGHVTIPLLCRRNWLVKIGISVPGMKLCLRVRGGGCEGGGREGGLTEGVTSFGTLEGDKLFVCSLIFSFSSFFCCCLCCKAERHKINQTVESLIQDTLN